MAACGLEISRRNSTESSSTSESDSKYNVVRVMVEFAAKMMSVLESIKMQTTRPYK